MNDPENIVDNLLGRADADPKEFAAQVKAEDDAIGRTWRLYTYDVWGNEEDGYEVNNVFKTSDTVTIPKNVAEGSDELLIQHLANEGVIRGKNLGDFEIDGDEEVLAVSYRGKPIGELRVEDET